MPMHCRKMKQPGELQALPAPVFETLPPKEDGEGCVLMEQPGTLKEATTQEALQRGTVYCIIVRDKKVEGDDFVEIIRHYSKASSLGTVYLSSCRLGISGGQHMARSLDYLTNLFLESNGIKDGGITTLATAVGANNNLKVLGIVSEGFGVVGARALAGALQTNTCLSRLDVSGNMITQEGAKEMAFALKRNSGNALKTLVMDTEYGGIRKGEAQGLLRAFMLQYSIT
eukprot:CAMPEP_0173381824 /NCGR_PEP_ID=MMETSP1356-20130122/4252_1 /TAXON_ID=77927 ORGANISM="Hemiselmis virescens, Strain PCC157" /NCGR_SAMPLE_ID=MMETSP1356 /ASSEMBLY_ACC=CAM_ASM_000847 /LENGTH=227 /DNA_ID=CAMNT_0014335847 /DNA_START=52 /DNA_END=735 /DNA_ORIENTATION=-